MRREKPGAEGQAVFTEFFVAAGLPIFWVVELDEKSFYLAGHLGIAPSGALTGPARVYRHGETLLRADSTDRCHAFTGGANLVRLAYGSRIAGFSQHFLLLSALGLAAEIGDMRRFATPR